MFARMSALMLALAQPLVNLVYNGFDAETAQLTAELTRIMVLALVFSYDLNVLSLGEEIAASLGMRVVVVRFLFIVIASLLAGSAVSFAGLLGFIGLIVPHICRRFAGGDNRLVIPCAALLGAVFALVCDALGKWVFAPFELPVGIILALLGGPFFLFLLLKGGRGKIYD